MSPNVCVLPTFINPGTSFSVTLQVDECWQYIVRWCCVRKPSISV